MTLESVINNLKQSLQQRDLNMVIDRREKLLLFEMFLKKMCVYTFDLLLTNSL